MTDINGSFIACYFIEFFIYFSFRNGIKSCSRFVQYNKRGILINSSCNSYFLSLSAGNDNSLFIKILVEISIQTFWHCGKPVVKTGFLQSAFYFFFVIIDFGGYIFPKSQGKEFEVLKYHGKNRHIFFVIIFSDIDSVKKNVSFCRIVKTTQELDKRSLSTSIHTNDSHLLTDFKFQINISKGILFTSRISERNISKFYFILSVTAFFSSQASLIHVIGNVQKFKCLFQKNSIVLHIFNGGDTAGYT